MERKDNSWVFFIVAFLGLIWYIVADVKKKEEASIVKSKIEEIEDRRLELLEIEKERADSILEAKAEAEETKRFLKTKAGKIWLKHQNWAREDCEAIAERKVWIGMSYEMLKYMRGLPNAANPSNYGNGTSWQWCWEDYTPSCFYDNDGDGIIDAYN